jgi:hypothetical protein
MTRRRVGYAMAAIAALYDLTAWPPHIQAHSWSTLAIVALITAGHLSDLLTANLLTVPCPWERRRAE